MKKTISILITLLIIFSLQVNTSNAQATRGGLCSIETITTEKACKDAKGVWVADYNFLAPFGDEPENQAFNPARENALSTYLNLMIKVVIGIAAVLAVIMIVMGGIQYMTSELISSKEEGKKRITNAIMGLVVAMGAYLILFTINPNLLNLEPKIDPVTLVFTIDYIPPSESQTIKLTQTQNTVEGKKFKRTSFYEALKTIAAQYNIPNCLLQVAILRESGGVRGLVGHDEEAPYSGIPSRRNFINSGKKFNGTTFTPSQNLITDRSFHNTDHAGNNLYSAPNTNAWDLGLDWRFSHGVGLFGITMYPKGSSYADYSVGIKTDIPGYPVVKPKDLYQPIIDMKLAASVMKKNYAKCGGDIEKTYRAYGSGSCNGGGDFLNREAPLRKNLYDQCLAQE